MGLLGRHRDYVTAGASPMHRKSRSTVGEMKLWRMSKKGYVCLDETQMQQIRKTFNVTNKFPYKGLGVVDKGLYKMQSLEPTPQITLGFGLNACICCMRDLLLQKLNKRYFWPTIVFSVLSPASNQLGETTAKLCSNNLGARPGCRKSIKRIWSTSSTRTKRDTGRLNKISRNLLSQTSADWIRLKLVSPIWIVEV